MRRRFLLVPFTVQIPVAERDPQLVDNAQDRGAEILRWMVDGCLAWQRDGLAYFKDRDTLGQWIEEALDRTDPARMDAHVDLFTTWLGASNAI